MIDLSDEMLCKYLDSELDADAAKEVEAALALDSGARVRLQRMRDADAALRKAIPQPTTTNDPVANFIRSGGQSESPSAAALNQRANMRRRMMLGSIAASFLGIVIGALATYQLSGNAALEQSLASATMDTSKSLSLALDTIKSGASLQHNSDKVQMILSFNALGGRHCRVFEVANAKGGAEGVACHDNTRWQVVAWDATQSKSDGFRTAGGGEMVDSVMTRLGGNVALELSDEQKLIEGKWK